MPTKRQRSRDNNPLAKQHFNKVVRRNRQLKESLRSVFGVTWNLHGRTMVPVGSAPMMVMSSHASETAQNGETIELRCVNAQVNPSAGVIDYGDIRMVHDFAKNPHVGARGRILDPRDEGAANVEAGAKPNGSWVRLALELDRQRVRSVDENYKLESVPTMPTFWAAFNSMDAIDLEVTEALKDDIAEHMNKPRSHVDQMAHSDVMTLARAHWPELWKAPNTEGNDTGLWLIPARYTTKVGQAVRIFEDFSEMVGVDCWNPARDIKAMQFENPCRECATSLSIDLDNLLKVIAAGAEPADVTVAETVDAPHNCMVDGDEIPEMTATEFVSPYDQAVDDMLQLRQCIRGTLGEHVKHFSDEQLNALILNPDEPVLIDVTDLCGQLDEEDVVKLMRQQLEATRPIFSEGTTDEDLLAAAQNPSAPLHCSKVCHLQILYCDPRQDAETNFTFDSSRLGVAGVEAHLWAGQNWSPAGRKTKSNRRRRRNNKGRKQEHATTK